MYMTRECFTEEEIEAGRALLQHGKLGFETLPATDPLRYRTMTRKELRAMQFCRERLEAVILRRDGPNWRVYMLHKKPTMVHDVSPPAGEAVLQDVHAAVGHALNRLWGLLQMPTIETIAQRILEAADGTFHLRQRRLSPRHDISQHNKEGSMGLDAGIYNQDEVEMLYFRNHHDLLSRFFAEPHVRIEPYDDFYVTRPMVTNMLKDIEDEMSAAGLALTPLAERVPDGFEDLLREVPKRFCFEEPSDWASALPYYRVLLTRLLALVRAEGVLICGWSA